jgi:hypothetical protein
VHPRHIFGARHFAANGSTSATIQITLLGDGLFEPNESFSAELTSWPGPGAGGHAEHFFCVEGLTADL